MKRFVCLFFSLYFSYFIKIKVFSTLNKIQISENQESPRRNIFHTDESGDIVDMSTSEIDMLEQELKDTMQKAQKRETRRISQVQMDLRWQ